MSTMRQGDSVRHTGSAGGSSPQWVSIDKAAAHLGLSPEALRKTLERRAVRAADGTTEANLDGVRARKLGRLWRVRFSEAWGTP